MWLCEVLRINGDKKFGLRTGNRFFRLTNFDVPSKRKGKYNSTWFRLSSVLAIAKGKAQIQLLVGSELFYGHGFKRRKNTQLETVQKPRYKAYYQATQKAT